MPPKLNIMRDSKGRGRFIGRPARDQPSAGITKIAMLLVLATLCLAVGFIVFRVWIYQGEESAPVALTALPTPTASPELSATPSHPSTATPERPRPDEYGYVIQRVRYGLHPDKVRVVVDLEVRGLGPAEEPKYDVETTEDELIVRFDFGGSTVSLAPDHPVVELISLSVSEESKAIMHVQLNSPVRLDHFVLDDPKRIVFDLYPQ